jgi:ABC-type Fe3+-citrate transport system substrate-binding protein
VFLLFVAVYKLAVASCNPNGDGESTADTRTADEKGTTTVLVSCVMGSVLF